MIVILGTFCNKGAGQVNRQHLENVGGKVQTWNNLQIILGKRTIDNNTLVIIARTIILEPSLL